MTSSDSASDDYEFTSETSLRPESIACKDIDIIIFKLGSLSRTLAAPAQLSSNVTQKD